MRREKLEDWARLEFIKLLGPDGDGIWTEAEEILKRKKLVEFTPQEGRINARFTGEKPIRCQLLVPIIADEEKQALFNFVKNSTLSSALLLSDKLPWSAIEFENLMSPGSFIPVNFGIAAAQASFTGSVESVDDEPSVERFSPYSAATYLELIRRFDSDLSLFFTIRGLSKEELISFIKESRSNLWRGINQKGLEENLDFDHNSYDMAKPELFLQNYQLRADELPALLFKRVEGIPLTEGAEVVDVVLTELYAHIAKRAQAYGLSLGTRASVI
jgi:uncharacterized Zn finger protein